jgi:hypothetical protein
MTFQVDISNYEDGSVLPDHVTEKKINFYQTIHCNNPEDTTSSNMFLTERVKKSGGRVLFQSSNMFLIERVKKRVVEECFFIDYIYKLNLNADKRSFFYASFNMLGQQISTKCLP